jgi:hypothetical protein
VGYVQVLWEGTTQRCEPDQATKEKFKSSQEHFHTSKHWATPASVELLFDSLWTNVVKPKMEAAGKNPEEAYWFVIHIENF